MATYPVVKLSEIEGQEHITAILRTEAQYHIPPKKYTYFIGGREKDRQLLIQGYRASMVCVGLVSGDACGACAPCLGLSRGLSLYLNGLHTISVGEEPYVQEPNSAYYFLKPATTELTDEYREAVKVFVRCARAESRVVIVAAREYLEKYSFESLLANLLVICRNILLVKAGGDISAPDALKTLYASFSAPTVVSAIKSLWTDSKVPSRLDDDTAASFTCLFLAQILNPSFVLNASDAPIIEVESVPLSFAELEQLTLEAFSEVSNDGQTRELGPDS